MVRMLSPAHLSLSVSKRTCRSLCNGEDLAGPPVAVLKWARFERFLDCVPGIHLGETYTPYIYRRSDLHRSDLHRSEPLCSGLHRSGLHRLDTHCAEPIAHTRPSLGRPHIARTLSLPRAVSLGPCRSSLVVRVHLRAARDRDPCVCGAMYAFYMRRCVAYCKCVRACVLSSTCVYTQYTFLFLHMCPC